MEAGGDAPATIRVFVVDDHALIRVGLRMQIEFEPDLELVGEASTLHAALTKIGTAAPDVVIVDIGLGDGDGTELIRWLAQELPSARAIVLSGADDESSLHRAITAGAAAFVAKDGDLERLLEIVRLVGHGESFADAMLDRYVERRSARATSGSERLATLTRQERAVLTLLGDGLTNREISERLFVAEKTVRNHVSNILRKLRLRHRTEAALFVSSLATR